MVILKRLKKHLLVMYDRSLWEELKHNKSPLLLIVGEKDKKFKTIAESMCSKLGTTEDGSAKHPCRMVEIPNCGHAVHIENPLLAIHSIREFLTRVNVLDP